MEKGEILKVHGKEYVHVGDGKVAEVDGYDIIGGKRVPRVKAVRTITKKHPDGRQDCTVIVPTLRLAGKAKSPGDSQLN